MKNVMTKLLVVILMTVMMITSFDTVCATTEVQAATYTKKIKGTYHQTDARKMLKLINKFRTGDEAWYYASDGSTVAVKGLKKLKYSYELEKVAMQRAAELVVYFEHTRPNGTGFSSMIASSNEYAGENLASGSSTFCGREYFDRVGAFETLKETDCDYFGQGHRRVMLYKHFTCVGIACFEYKGIKYWVQIFGSSTDKTTKTKACNKKKTVKVEVDDSICY